MGRAVVVQHQTRGLEREVTGEPVFGFIVMHVLELDGLEVAWVDHHRLVDVLRKVNRGWHVVSPLS